MITSITVLTVQDGQKQKFIDMTEELVQKSNEEEGCISFNLYEDPEKDNVVAFIENWKDEAAIDFHGNTEFFQRIVPEILKLCVGEPVFGGKFKDIFKI